MKNSIDKGEIGEKFNNLRMLSKTYNKIFNKSCYRSCWIYFFNGAVELLIISSVLTIIFTGG